MHHCSKECYSAGKYCAWLAVNGQSGLHIPFKWQTRYLVLPNLVRDNIGNSPLVIFVPDFAIDKAMLEVTKHNLIKGGIVKHLNCNGLVEGGQHGSGWH